MERVQAGSMLTAHQQTGSGSGAALSLQAVLLLGVLTATTASPS